MDLTRNLNRLKTKKIKKDGNEIKTLKKQNSGAEKRKLLNR